MRQLRQVCLLEVVLPKLLVPSVAIGPATGIGGRRCSPKIKKVKKLLEPAPEAPLVQVVSETAEG